MYRGSLVKYGAGWRAHVGVFLVQIWHGLMGNHITVVEVKAATRMGGLGSGQVSCCHLCFSCFDSWRSRHGFSDRGVAAFS